MSLYELVENNYTSPELRFQYYFETPKEANDLLLLQQNSKFDFYKLNGDVPVFGNNKK